MDQLSAIAGEMPVKLGQGWPKWIFNRLQPWSCFLQKKIKKMLMPLTMQPSYQYRTKTIMSYEDFLHKLLTVAV